MKFQLAKVQTCDSLGTGPEALTRLLTQLAAQDEEHAPFFVCDLGDVYRKHRQWQRLLPRVEPFYAIKCNTDTKVLESLVAMGTGFDCASRGEIEKMLSLGVHPSNIIYANPCKQVSMIKYAYEHGVDMMTFDNEDELVKMAAHHPRAKAVIRILADDSKSICQFGVKFGVHPGLTRDLLIKAQELGVSVIGVSFHVGSGCLSAAAFSDAVHRARRVFDEAEGLGMKMNFLDLGGGFPGCEGGVVSFKDIATELNCALEECFPPSCGVRIIAEPGRYYVASAYTMCANILAKRTVKRENGVGFMYYINDGVYGAFNSLMFDHAVVTPKLLKDVPEGTPKFESSVWGPTCDSMDCLTRNTELPELFIGDWMFFENMGAYTIAAASNFNGFSRPEVFYTFSASEWFDAAEVPVGYPILPKQQQRIVVASS